MEVLREIFSRHGLPDTIVSDNATSFVSAEFHKFLFDNKIRHVTPPAYCLASNGQGEVAVRVMKNILRKNTTGSMRSRLSSALLY